MIAALLIDEIIAREYAFQRRNQELAAQPQPDSTAFRRVRRAPPKSFGGSGKARPNAWIG